jgi:hypothetical protein
MRPTILHDQLGGIAAQTTMDGVEIHAGVSRMLEAVCEPDSKNRFTVVQLRDHAVEFLSFYDFEIERFPKLVGTTHSNFVMADYDLSREAVFVAFFFHPQFLELVAGRCEAFLLRSLVEQEWPEDESVAGDWLRSRARFAAAPIRVQRPLAVKWLGRDWR